MKNARITLALLTLQQSIFTEKMKCNTTNKHKNKQTNKKAKNEHRNRDFQLHTSKITQSLYQLQNNYNDKKIVSQFLVRLEKTVTEMATGCLRMIKSAIFERR